MAVLNPLKLVITTYPVGQTETIEAANNPEDANAGSRTLTFSRELYIERDDFMEMPPKKFFRLAPGQEVRLKYIGYIIKCEEVIKDADGNIVELRCSHDPATRSGGGSTRSVKGTIHWLSAAHCGQAQVRLFDRLFTEPFMDAIPEGHDYKEYLNPNSLQTLIAFVEPSLTEMQYGAFPVQFERLGYFAIDPCSVAGAHIFNRKVTLKDTWAKVNQT
jgi:glutaminyl-tRNA synthetase